MTYDITQTLVFLPYVAWAALALTFIFLEVRAFRETLADGPVPEAGRGSFIPPRGEGYEYYVSASTMVYILKKNNSTHRVYLISGEAPAAKLKQDRYGTYFTVRAANAATVENIVDRACGR